MSWWANVAPPVFARSRFLSGRASIKSALAGLGPSALEGWLGVTRGGTGKARAFSYQFKNASVLLMNMNQILMPC